MTTPHPNELAQGLRSLVLEGSKHGRNRPVASAADVPESVVQIVAERLDGAGQGDRSESALRAIAWDVLVRAVTDSVAVANDDAKYLVAAAHLIAQGSDPSNPAREAPYGDIALLAASIGMSVQQLRSSAEVLPDSVYAESVSLRRVYAAAAAGLGRKRDTLKPRKGRTHPVEPAVARAFTRVLEDEPVLLEIAARHPSAAVVVQPVDHEIESAEREAHPVDEVAAPSPEGDEATPPRPRRRIRAVVAAAVGVLIVGGIALGGAITGWFGLAPAAEPEASRVIRLPLETTTRSEIAEAGWGPTDREAISFQSRNSQVALNSMIDRPDYGDERNFMKARSEAGGDFTDTIAVQPGNVYEVSVFFGNDAAPGSVQSDSVNTRLKIDLSYAIVGAETGSAILSSDNAVIPQVWDAVTFVLPTDSEIAALRYVSDSATIHSEGAVDGLPLGDELFEGGVLIGCDALDGVLPSRDECAGHVTFKVRVDTSNAELVAAARVKGTEDPFSTQLTASVGDVLQVRVMYQNTGTHQEDDVMLSIAELPVGLRYVSGSSQIANSTTEGKYRATPDDVMTGLDLGSYRPMGNAFVVFDLMVDEAILEGDVAGQWLTLDPFVRVGADSSRWTEAPLSLAILRDDG